jgi:hypothetical protein
MLPNLPLGAAVERAEQLRQAFATMPIGFGEQVLGAPPCRLDWPVIRSTVILWILSSAEPMRRSMSPSAKGGIGWLLLRFCSRKVGNRFPAFQ